MRLFRTYTLAAGLTLSLSGCAGHFMVKPISPGSPASGFRYYLPVPYLLITNMKIESDSSPAPQGKAAAGDSTNKTLGPTTGHMGGVESDPSSVPVVSVKLIWLPDTSHPYAITSKGGGLGTFKGGLQLTDGWMLTNVSEESDAKVADTITAVSGLISNALAPGGLKNKDTGGSTPVSAAPFMYLFEVDLIAHKLTQVDTSALNSLLVSQNIQH